MAFIEGVAKSWLKRKRPFQNLNKETPRNSESNSKMKTANCEEPICPPRELTEILIQQARQLQMLPDVAVQALKVAEDPDAKIKELVAVVGQDVMLTTNILALSNSPMFGSGRTVSCLQVAISRLGFRQTKNMILASCITSMLKNMEWEETHVRDQLCQHSFLTGIISTRLNTLFKLGMQGEEFTAGLVHDIGRTLLAVAVPHEFRELDPLDFQEDDQLLERELLAIGTTHAEIGGWFLQRNHLPDELVSVARFHHNPQESSMYLRLVGLVAIADDLANYHQRFETEAFDCSSSQSVKLLESLGIENATQILSDNWEEVIASSSEEVSRMISF